MTRPLQLLTCLVLLALPGCFYAPIDLGDLAKDLGKTLEVVVVNGDESDKILMVRIDGEISTHGESGFFSSGPSLVSRVVADLERARQDPSIKGILLRVDSPGGGVTASDLIHHELARFKAERQVPIVAWFGDTAASGGYYVAMAADKIVSSPTAITGSIGVITQVIHVHELAEKVGVQVDAITSGGNKDMGSPFRPMREEERALLQTLIDEMYGRFVDIVADGRESAGLTRAQVVELADGRVYTAKQAHEAKLVDSIGYLEDAVLQLAQLGGLSAKPQVIAYQEGGFGGGGDATRYSAGTGGVDLRLTSEGGAVLEAARRLLPGPGATLQYLWTPGR